MDSSQTSLPRFYSKPLVEIKGPHDSEMSHSKADVTEYTAWFNYTGMDVYRIDRAYPPILLSPKTHPIKKSVLVIRKELHISHRAKEDLRKYISKDSGTRNPAMIAFYDLFNSHYSSSYGSMSLPYDYEITNEELNANDGSLVHLETGILLSTRQDNIPAHPFSQEAILDDMWPIGPSDNAGVSFLLADREGKIGKRYIYDRGRVITLHPVNNFQQPDGLYIRFIKNGNETSREKEIEYMTVDAVLKAEWIHKTYRDAQHDSEAILDKELRLKEKDITLKEMTTHASLEKIGIERETTTSKFYQESVARQAEMERVIAAQHAFLDEARIKNQQLLIRDNYEAASLARKDTSELSKYIGPLVMALVTGLGYFFTRAR